MQCTFKSQEDYLNCPSVKSLTFLGRNFTLVGVKVAVQVAVFPGGTFSQIRIAFAIISEVLLVHKCVSHVIF